MASLTVGEFAQLIGLLLGALLFITLIVVDIRKAVKKGNFWVPGHALVLSALTIKLMNFVEDRSALLNRALLDQNSNCTDVQNSNCTDVSKVQFMNFIQVQGALLYQNSKPLVAVASNVTSNEIDEVIKDTMFMVHCSRVMLCVLIAFFLPGMARPGYEEKWSTIAALGFSIFLHIFSELLRVKKELKAGIQLVWYFFYGVNDVLVIVYGAIISISLVWLLHLLISATIANKGIRNITLQRIPLILANPGENSWKAVEDQVLKPWIVARACYPESIIANSALASSAALAVAMCIVLSIVSWIVQGPITKILPGPGFWLKFIITIVEIVFILIGEAIIGWRWFTSVVYYGRWRRKEKEWRNYFRVEDYWTKHIVELQKTEISPMPKRLHDDDDKRANKIIDWEGKSKKVPWFLLQYVLWLQWFVVFLSKGYWFISELVVTNKLVHKIATMILSKHLGKVDAEFKEYEAVLGNVYILSETPRSVFLTNRKVIKQAKGFMEKGNKDGEMDHALISFLKHRRPETGVGISYLHPGTAHDQTGLKFLWKRDPGSALDMERYFISSSKRSWKLTAVSLINIISRLEGDSCAIANCSCGGDNFKVYEEAWELMDLVEESDPEIDSLLSKAADRQFMTLRDQSAQNGKRSPAPATTMEEAIEAIKGLAEESKREAKEAEINDNGQDTPVDWEKLAAGTTLYKICMSMDCSSGDLRELVKELQSTLAHIIGSCIEKVGVALVENSRKWAQEMEERKLLEAVYIAGKSKGLMEQLEWDPKLHIGPTTKVSGSSLNVFNDPPTEESAMV